MKKIIVCSFGLFVSIFFTVCAMEKSREEQKLNRALFKSIKRNDVDAVKKLLDDGADLDARDDTGKTPLMAASHSKYTDACKFLLEMAADVNQQSDSGSTALMLAAIDGHADIVKLLLDAGADVALQNYKGWTALTCAFIKGDPTSVEFLIEYGAGINHQDNEGHTPLMRAAGSCYIEIMRFILRQGVDVDAQCPHGTNALFAVLNKHHGNCFGHARVSNDLKVKAMKLLLAYGAQINAASCNSGATAFMRAAMHGYDDIVALLFARTSADIYALTKDGKTAFMYAKENSHYEITDMLEEAQVNNSNEEGESSDDEKENK